MNEYEEEEQPESLRKKWEAEEFSEEIVGKQSVQCPHCEKWIEKRSFFCLYCGERVFEESGLLGNLAAQMKQGKGLVLFLLIACAIGLFFVFF